MLAYRDRTFCPFWEACTEGSRCPFALTDRVREGAVATELNIVEYAEEPECYRPMSWDTAFE